MLVFGLRSGVLLDPGLARCWERGGSVRFDSPGGRSCGVLVPCAGRGVRGKVLALFSFYAPVSGPAFDAERRSAMNELSTLLSSFPVRAVLLLGGDFNAEVGFKGVGVDSATKVVWEIMPTDAGIAVGIRWWNGQRGRLCFSWRLFIRKRIEIRGIILMMDAVIHWIMSCVVLVIFAFWVLLRFCTKMLFGAPALQLGQRIRMTILLRSDWPKAGFFVSPRG